MKIYNYSASTKEYLGEALADESPLEPGQFLIPAHATPVPPPVISAGHAAVFNGSAWDLVEDHRAEPLWSKATALAARVTELGSLPSTLTALPPDNPYPAWNEAEQKWEVDVETWKECFLRPGRDTAMAAAENRVRRFENQLAAQLPTTESAEIILALRQYMQRLRDLPKTAQYSPSFAFECAPGLLEE
ncbi:MAG: hypothetical protein GX410_01705 [Elusimicrobia bacterium]|nr:hypothetical protein [Elusimicrobiota bacterium]